MTQRTILRTAKQLRELEDRFEVLEARRLIDTLRPWPRLVSAILWRLPFVKARLGRRWANPYATIRAVVRPLPSENERRERALQDEAADRLRGQ